MATESWDGHVQLWAFNPKAQEFRKTRLLSFEDPGYTFYANRVKQQLLQVSQTELWEHVGIWIAVPRGGGSEWVLTKNIINMVRIWKVGPTAVAMGSTATLLPT